MRRPLLLLAAMLAACPAFAQVDLSGEWSNLTHEDVNHRQSVEIGDYTGLPINEAARFKAESWDEAVLATHERQCIPHVVTYAMRGQPGNIRIGKRSAAGYIKPLRLLAAPEPIEAVRPIAVVAGGGGGGRISLAASLRRRRLG